MTLAEAAYVLDRLRQVQSYAPGITAYHRLIQNAVADALTTCVLADECYDSCGPTPTHLTFDAELAAAGEQSRLRQPQPPAPPLPSSLVLAYLKLRCSQLARQKGEPTL